MVLPRQKAREPKPEHAQPTASFTADPTAQQERTAAGNLRDRRRSPHRYHRSKCARAHLCVFHAAGAEKLEDYLELIAAVGNRLPRPSAYPGATSRAMVRRYDPRLERHSSVAPDPGVSSRSTSTPRSNWQRMRSRPPSAIYEEAAQEPAWCRQVFSSTGATPAPAGAITSSSVAANVGSR